MIKAWLKAVFWGTTAKSFWTFGSITSTIFGLTPYASEHPLLRLEVPLSLFVVGFFVSSCIEYMSLARKLEKITSALTLTTSFTQAGEVMVLESKRHTIVADIYLMARNQSTDGNSLRLQSCFLDVADASLSYLMFIESNAGNYIVFKPSDILKLDPKSETKPVVKAVFSVPESPFPIPAPNDQVRGSLKVMDIHDSIHDVKFPAVLLRNAPASL
jgi:hypothetical protein